MFAWRYGSADITRRADQPFSARSEFVQLDTLGIVKSQSTVRRFRRNAQQAADGTGACLIAFNTGASTTVVRQHDQEEVYGAGQIWLGSTADALDVASDTGTNWVTLLVPASRLLQVVPGAEDMVAKPIDAGRPAVRHLRRYMEFLLETGGTDDEHALTGRLDAMLLDLVALALGANGDVAEIAGMRGLRAARIREILAKIHQGFSSPAFSAQIVGQWLGLSPRYVQELMQETGIGFTARVLELRLQRPARCSPTRSMTASRSAISPMPAGSTRCPTSTAVSAAASVPRPRNFAGDLVIPGHERIRRALSHSMAPDCQPSAKAEEAPP
ncbi:hypothetical protein [Methyloceanibacter superfactus]|uniref:AraC-like ligand-binding domain-containing protein n=1 Tax=Methyloceanibacter superfactus TaxID=1774969 RepID=UPI00244EF6D6|nr:hypothetical protein [Methyloceanibacter superfactus]